MVSCWCWLRGVGWCLILCGYVDIFLLIVYYLLSLFVLLSCFTGVWAAPPHFIELCSVNTSIAELERTYCAMNLMLDETVGNLTCALKENGMVS